MSSSETAYYLYCLTPGGCGIKTSVIGVDGQCSVSVRACGEFGAVLSEVERGDFCGESAEARLQDLTWLGLRACQHEAVIEEVMSQTPVLPARFATLFTSIDSLPFRAAHTGGAQSMTPMEILLLFAIAALVYQEVSWRDKARRIQTDYEKRISTEVAMAYETSLADDERPVRALTFKAEKQEPRGLFQKLRARTGLSSSARLV